MDTKELKFSEVEYDTTKAKKLFTECSQFFGMNCENTKEFVEDSVGNRISLSKLCELSCSDEEPDIAKKLWRLSELVDENAELFCQLEYTIRKIKPEELKALDLKLIVQNLIYCASRKDKGYKLAIAMYNDSPLVNLALAAQQMLRGFISIYSEPQTAVVSWLFADLCVKAGFRKDRIYLFLRKSLTEDLLPIIQEFKNGCLAVVTAKSDLDSAVDVLVETPDRNPWKVKRILVQESVLRRFRISVGDKARRKSGAKVDEELFRQCTSGYRYEEKTYLFDFVGGEAQLNEKSGIILVEAYRTVKELLTLLNNFKPYALSVWSDSVAESNEISHNVPSNIIWINSFGNFDGPPQASQSFFSIIENTYDKCLVNVEPRKLLEVWKSWSALHISERAIKLKHLEECNMLAVYDGFHYVSDKYVCAGTNKPVHAVYINNHTNISDILSYVVKGGCIVLDRAIEYPKSILDLVDTLRSVDAPVGWSCDTKEKEASNLEVTDIFEYATKVVWTSFGTIFSN